MSFTVTVSGRPAARLVPAGGRLPVDDAVAVSYGQLAAAVVRAGLVEILAL